MFLTRLGFKTVSQTTTYFTGLAKQVDPKWKKRSGWPDEFVKKMPKMFLAQYISSKCIHYLNCGKISPKLWATFVIFKKLPEVKSPNGRKFAQSGHPSRDRYVNLFHDPWWDNRNRVQWFLWLRCPSCRNSLSLRLEDNGRPLVFIWALNLNWSQS
jgi:hypothetical protein